MDPEPPLLPLPLTQRLSVPQWTTVDVVVAVLLAAAAIGGTAAGLDRVGQDNTFREVLRYLLIVTACGALPFRRRYPLPVLAVVTVAVTGVIGDGSRGPMMLAVILAIYTVASLCPPRTSFRAAVLVIAAVLFATLIATARPSLVGPPLILVGWLAGENTRTRRAYIAGVTEWAAERDHQREERSRRAVADERLRIARELHDVVAHAMSVVAVRSGVARVVLRSQPDEAAKALEIIETTSRRAMHEMRLLVGVLREGDASGELAPTPGLADLQPLVQEIAAAGVSVDVHIDGTPRPLPAGVDVSAFRIVQEALTNVVRHARPAEARLDLRYRPDEIEIEVTDNGARHRPPRYPSYPLTPPNGGAPAAAATTTAATVTPSDAPPINGTGHGLLGMRERVALFGGTFDSGPTPTGFRVKAVLRTDEGQPTRS